MPSASPELIEIATRHQVFFERLKTHDANQFDSFLRRMDDDLRKQLTKKDITEFTRARLNRQLEFVGALIDDVYQDYKRVWKDQLIDAGQYEAEFEQKSLNKVVINREFALPTETQLSAAIFGNPLSVEGVYQGALLDQFFDDVSGNTKTRVTNAIRLGYAQGQTTQQVIQRIRGTAARNYTDGLMNLSKRDAEIIARTSLQHVSSQARESVWKRNSDIIKKVRIVATLDNRTTQICRSLDSQEFPIDSGPRPPFHIRCRTSTTAVLDDRFAILEKGATRAARDADGNSVSVPAKETYYDWLKRQSADFQDEVIGKTRGKLLRDGGLSSQRFAELQLGKRFEPLNIEQIKKLEPLAFERAGL